MADYSKEEIKNIEQKWRNEWEKRALYKVNKDTSKPKYYVLDMFPYPSGAGLHVGHPLGYIASDIVARFKRIKGFNVLHPMGFDAFGLPAEQYALEHGIHPAISTQDNINNFKRQLGKIGFCYDWSREVQTCDPSYYKWTQWIFLQIFDSWFNRKKEKAERISELISIFENEGNANHPIQNSKFRIKNFSAAEWKGFDERTQQEILMQYRLAYLAYTDVNWCEALGTVLANDEVINGVSYRGGFPVVKKQMRQWSLRITEYADRLLKGLDEIDFSESMKDIQRNWIGKSVGAELEFKIQHSEFKIKVFTTRPDTIFGVDFMVIAPEHELVKQITSDAQREDIEKYLKYVESRSEVDRMAEVKKITGAFTGAYATNPFNGNQIPIWISEYVLAGYGTGAIMAVPCGDERDHKFAKHFKLPITNIIGSHYNGEEANPTKDAVLENSGFLNGLVMRDAIDVAIQELEKRGIGKRQVNYKMRDAGWSRQRYWGEPFPVVFKDDMPYAMKESELPLELPPSDNFKPSGNGEGPLANLADWINFAADQKRDSNTMPTHAGAAWYFLRYMDPNNTTAFADPKALDYWKQVDVYIGGAEHAVAHLLYARLWTKVLHDLGYLKFDEPFKKLINQGKITGDSRFVYRLKKSAMGDKKSDPNPELPNVFVGYTTAKKVMDEVKDSEIDKLNQEYDSQLRALNEGKNSYTFSENLSVIQMHVDISCVDGLELDEAALKKWKPGEFENAMFIRDNEGKYICGSAIEKMSKSYYNVVNPDEIINNYGADTLRMYEMFLGPLEASKPWSTQGIDGVFKFLRKVWNLIHDQSGNLKVSEAEATREELKVLHKTIKKVEQDIENFSFNTSVSEFMICVNELGSLKCDKRAIVEPLVIALSPFAPHIAEELWEKLGHRESILMATYPKYDDQYLVESTFSYPISINGKVRAQMEFALDMPKEDIEKIVLASEIVQKWTEGKPPKKMIVVPGRIVNVVL
ncbi:MAG: leucine--tRNA ligase [Cytophagales bacterium]|jgi:leucyl-tRNA synthetase|nr:leucine--tRNA ligase [Cytophagales bacterium]MCA6389547.1 leucine--tRNA ligase [Cytophagales bacterium]MCA6392671.1 leucine--tRNA ligase [Cytophagales bacterium]MCA6399322.1 leucine--tRNA ligase [Cytophagales bacterium]MCA6402082.1 leucine--tRNA ligase [Cytophagales bacterium]